MTESIQQKCNLKDLTRTELVAMLAGMGKERFRADQIITWLYRHRVTNTLYFNSSRLPSGLPLLRDRSAGL